LLILISLNCREQGIRYDTKIEVVLKPTTIKYEGVNGLYYDFDGKIGYEALMITREKKYYLIEKGRHAKILDKEIMEKLINEARKNETGK
jgi:hypothetical protein